ncbi:MAG: GMC oxidoreductase, partial [Actinomycetes bacterium]
QRIHLLRGDKGARVLVLAGAGVGGGSLVYANTLYEPLDPFYRDPSWQHITDWKAELAPYYDQAKRMLGVVENPLRTAADDVMKQVADEMGVGDTFHPTPVGVFFGGPGETHHDTIKDPYFGGAGPDRVPCKACGECMTGCRHGAKNTLPKNYLWLAEQAGAEVRPLTTVTSLMERPQGGWEVETVRTGPWRGRRPRRTFTASHVVVAAGAYGTQRLLHRMRDEGKLPRISDRLGLLTRTNSESILGAQSRRRDNDYTRGVAITSSFYPTKDTHVEPVRYGHGSNAMGLLSTVLTEGGSGSRVLRWMRACATHPGQFARSLSVHHWSERTVIGLVMQAVDNSIVVSGKRTRLGRWRLTSRQGHGQPNPTWIPEGNDAIRRLARVVDGDPGGNLGDLVGATMTAHFLGGVVIGATPETGVIDAWHRVFGHPGLHVVDGSAVSANLGANPSLTITAQAERAMSFWPNKGEPDPRPPLGAAYSPVARVAARHPTVSVDVRAAADRVSVAADPERSRQP